MSPRGKWLLALGVVLAVALAVRFHYTQTCDRYGNCTLTNNWTGITRYCESCVPKEH